MTVLSSKDIVRVNKLHSSFQVILKCENVAEGHLMGAFLAPPTDSLRLKEATNVASAVLQRRRE